MKNQNHKQTFNLALTVRLNEVKNSFNFSDCEEKYRFACGYLSAATVVTQDLDWADMWGVMLEQEYLHKRNSLHDREMILEDTPF